jgi:preprotein translocase subunit SecE
MSLRSMHQQAEASAWYYVLLVIAAIAVMSLLVAMLNRSAAWNG